MRAIQTSGRGLVHADARRPSSWWSASSARGPASAVKLYHEREILPSPPTTRAVLGSAPHGSLAPPIPPRFAQVLPGFDVGRAPALVTSSDARVLGSRRSQAACPRERGVEAQSDRGAASTAP